MTAFDEIFWSRILMGPNCWLYQGAINQSGYGTLNRRHVMKSAHRTAWEQVHGPIPDGMQVLHRCDVRHCVRPSHLFLGTNADNMADKQAKGRHLSKLMPEQIREIRQLLASGTVQQKEIAKQFGISNSQVSTIKLRRQWKHVT